MIGFIVIWQHEKDHYIEGMRYNTQMCYYEGPLNKKIICTLDRQSKSGRSGSEKGYVQCAIIEGISGVVVNYIGKMVKADSFIVHKVYNRSLTEQICDMNEKFIS
jgi:hypothetical protein